MKRSITLHPKLGVNPHLTYCPRCGGEANELMLIGNRTNIVECPNCDAKIIGGLKTGEKCPKCQYCAHFGDSSRSVGQIGEHDKLPATDVCDKCKEELETFKKEVEAGVIYFKCKCCPLTGVIKGHTRLAKAVREKSGIKAPNPVGIEFDDCKQHTTK